ncbi:unnamed protein product [Neospora caninum Liverpool]|uniref:Toxoplasma gondii family A protein n=1 Tax=Neospora caninum (strain Liverpool) TaxID=572307 RepID=F0VRJ1_NEOCL|nr:uncharacterized protein NCLIV_067640 [Neospora caninum Liverpool]CBZ56339.1 unnamed protein product [Neospora caninum Liverpool]CEL71099.1 TPA: hypothetical protein BN1204_067640 [Neospora caninum Liverpool]|eukprot:XP_003886364.1 uncharacterized protein NCLIV_067640 [Neospora caninum Liverpool]
MQRQLFRAVCLTLLLGTVLSCVASETSEQKPAADFTTTIPKEGLERDVEQVFYLGPSSTLQVIDETGKAKYLPEPSTSSDESLAESYPAAYRFENGACDFTQTVEFKDAFQGYTKPMWVLEESDSVETEGASMGGPLRYTFTNPSAEYLGGGSSFCVRFKTVLATGSDSVTTSTTSRTSNGDSNSRPPSTVRPEPDVPSNEDGQENRPNADQPPEPSPSLPGSGGHQDSSAGEDGKAEGHEQAAQKPNPNLSSVPSGTTGINASSPELPPEGTEQDLESHSVAEFTQNTTEGTPPAIEDGDAVGIAIRGHNGAPLRRLDETPATEEAYLTLIVHSAAWSSEGRMGAFTAVLLTVAVTLLQVS